MTIIYEEIKNCVEYLKKEDINFTVNDATDAEEQSLSNMCSETLRPVTSVHQSIHFNAIYLQKHGIKCQTIQKICYLWFDLVFVKNHFH